MVDAPEPGPAESWRRWAWVTCAALCAPAASAQSAPERRNWFNDPFFQVTAQVPGCPVPAGPFLTDAEKRVQSHGRAERGTTCWLAGKCERPNSYAYDQDIADAVQAFFHAQTPAPHSALWVTVQRRVVFIEGCVAEPRTGPRLEALIRSAVPDTERVIAIVYVKKAQRRPPYKLLSAPE
ncbi:MAG: BON domain-containing protein [Rhizobacter sp.]